MSEQTTVDQAQDNIEPIVIRSEEQAFELLRAVLADELTDQNPVIHFEGWPILTLRYEGKGFESTITPDIAEALLALQTAMNRAYARAVHDSGSARSLTDVERRQLQILAKVDKGSSLITIDLGKWGEALASALKDKMTSKSVAVTILGVAVIAGSVIAHKDYLQTKASIVLAENETKAKTAMTTAETERLKIMAGALEQAADLKHAAQDFNEARRKVLKAGGDAKSVTMQGVELTGAEARKIASAPRAESEDVQLNGHYVILKVDWQLQDEAKLTLSSQDGRGQFVAKFRVMTLAQDQKTKLKEAEWERKPLYMQINGTKLRGEITTATIIAAEWPKDKEPPTLSPGAQ